MLFRSTSVDGLNTKVERLNAAADVMCPTILEISGGIDLGPKDFTVKKGVASPEVQLIKDICDKADGAQYSDGACGMFVRSVGGDALSFPGRFRLSRKWDTKRIGTLEGRDYYEGASSSSERYWFLRDKGSSTWKDQLDSGTGRTRVRLFSEENRVVQIAEFEGGKVSSQVVGRFGAHDRIIFEKSNRTDLMPPISPPPWWPRN